MLPSLLFNNMEGSSNSLNNNANNAFGQLYDDNVILNSVRSRKKVSETVSCPVCSCTIRQGELESHLNLELDRLYKLSNSGSKRKLSMNSAGNSSLNPLPGSSTDEVPDDQEVDVSGCPGSDAYQRVHCNRLRRLRARRRGSPSPSPATGECPVCAVTMPTSRLQRHALRCLKRTGATMDEDVPTSSDESIDVENDSPGGFGAEYQWCGEWRVRAAALQPAEARPATCVRRASQDLALVVDGDEDTELYGPPQYSPSRIAPDAETTPSERASEEQSSSENGFTVRVIPDLRISFTEPHNKPNGLVEASAEAEITPAERASEEQSSSENGVTVRVIPDVRISFTEPHNKPNGLVEASAETRIQALKARIRELERKHNSASEAKCLICLAPYVSPAVSIQCWHVYCEVCWLESLKAKKICPQCSAITTAQHLRRIYM